MSLILENNFINLSSLYSTDHNESVLTIHMVFKNHEYQRSDALMAVVLFVCSTPF